MLHLGASVEVNREQQQDRLRRAERERLAQEATAGQKKQGAWQALALHLRQAVARQEGKEIEQDEHPRWAKASG